MIWNNMARDKTQKKLLYKVAKAYYEDGLTQQQIADSFGMSRIRVSRLLQKSIEEKVVLITITPPPHTTADLERRLEKAYGLKEALIVTPDDNFPQTIVSAIGKAAANYLVRCIQGNDIIGLTWGTAVLSVINSLPAVRFPDVKIVQLIGGLGKPQAHTHGTDLARRMAQSFGARPHLLGAPGVVQTRMVRDSLMTDPQIADPLKLAEQADIAVVGIGTLLPDSTLVKSECIFTDAEIEWLRQLNCVGDIALQFFDNDGRKVFTPLDQRIIGLTREQMQRIGRVIGVAGGMDKLAAIRGALRGKWLHVLVTNEEIALTLLREVEGENPAVELKQEVVNADE